MSRFTFLFVCAIFIRLIFTFLLECVVNFYFNILSLIGLHGKKVILKLSGYREIWAKHFAKEGTRVMFWSAKSELEKCVSLSIGCLESKKFSMWSSLKLAFPWSVGLWPRLMLFLSCPRQALNIEILRFAICWCENSWKQELIWLIWLFRMCKYRCLSSQSLFF